MKNKNNKKGIIIKIKIGQVKSRRASGGKDSQQSRSAARQERQPTSVHKNK